MCRAIFATFENMVGDQFDARHENEKNGENKDKQNNRWFRE